jgi:hypothetical protein
LIDNSSKVRWLNSNELLIDYKEYVKNKKEKFNLTFIDLLYVSNFKGGNSTIKGDEKAINIILKEYSVRFKKLNKIYGEKSLIEINDDEIIELIKTIELTIKDLIENHNINGFKYSYMSALLHAYFPNLLPILDRRILINLGLVTIDDIDSTKQVKKIEQYYGTLVKKIRDILVADKTKSIRNVDYENFILELPYWAKNSKKIKNEK